MEIKQVLPAFSAVRTSGGQQEIKRKINELFSILKDMPDNFRENTSDVFSNYTEYRHSRKERNNRSFKNKIAKFVPDFNKKSFVKWSVITLVSSVILVGGVKYVNSQPTSGNDSSSRTQIKGARTSKDINREFAFPLSDSDGEEVSQVHYIIETVELREEILVQGQKATAVEGRVFLVLSLKLVNDYTQPVEMKTRDYVRLSVNGNEEEWLAPDIHNDPVEVQALSTKYTRVGFAINESDENIILRIGEIQGDKETIEIDL